MKRSWLLLLFILPLFSDQSVVINERTGGRFGDNLVSYLHAKWFSYRHQIPLLCTPFPHSSSLVLDDLEISHTNHPLREELGLDPLFKTSVARWPILSKIPFLSIQYFCPYFPEEPNEPWKEGKPFTIDWQDTTFRNMARRLIAPKSPLPLIQPPPHHLSVAIHLREGGEYDSPDTLRKLPRKFPPLSYYIQCMTHLLSYFPEPPIYCFVFTDATNPAPLVETLRQAFPLESRIQWDFRRQNYHDRNVLEDFFSLFQFDILIRPCSNFSLIPMLLHDFTIVYTPKDYIYQDTIPYISEIDVRLEGQKCLNFHDIPNMVQLRQNLAIE